MSAPATVVRPCIPDDKPQVLSLAGKVYDEGICNRLERLFDWWQRCPTLAGDPYHYPTVIQRDGQVLGYTALARRRFKVAGMEFPGGFVFDTFTSPEHRGVGIAMLRHIRKQTNLLMGGALHPRADGLWRRIADRPDIAVFPFTKAVRLLDPAAFLPPWSRALLAWPARALAACAEFGLARFAPRLGKARIEAVARFPGETDAFCDQWAVSRKSTALRDSGYLNWRYAEAPMAYEKRVLRIDGRIAGISAYRCIRKRGRNMLLIAELLADEPSRAKAYGSLISEAIRFGRRNGVSDIQTLDAGCADMHHALMAWGFRFRRETGPVVGVIGLAMEKELDALYTYRDWFLTAGDGDLEFSYFNQDFGTEEPGA
jgi:hypothetical protein